MQLRFRRTLLVSPHQRLGINAAKVSETIFFSVHNLQTLVHNVAMFFYSYMENDLLCKKRDLGGKVSCKKKL